ncbi:MAG TPA: hypothetical protein PLP01_01980 [Phycisphaerae bacterium]|nr:hypothetical protein [Phycisphaerae bacterium]
MAFDFFDQWFDHSWSYCLNRCVAVMVRSSDVARLAQAVGLPEVTEEHVKRNPFEIAIRVDNLIRSFGHSVDDPEEDQLDD